MLNLDGQLSHARFPVETHGQKSPARQEEKHACKTPFGLEVMTESGNHPFDRLTPDLLIDAVESQGFLSDGGFLALNSYENRVYQIALKIKHR